MKLISILSLLAMFSPLAAQAVTDEECGKRAATLPSAKGTTNEQEIAKFNTECIRPKMCGSAETSIRQAGVNARTNPAAVWDIMRRSCAWSIPDGSYKGKISYDTALDCGLMTAHSDSLKWEAGRLQRNADESASPDNLVDLAAKKQEWYEMQKKLWAECFSPTISACPKASDIYSGEIGKAIAKTENGEWDSPRWYYISRFCGVRPR